MLIYAALRLFLIIIIGSPFGQPYFNTHLFTLHPSLSSLESHFMSDQLFPPSPLSCLSPCESNNTLIAAATLSYRSISFPHLLLLRPSLVWSTPHAINSALLMLVLLHLFPLPLFGSSVVFPPLPLTSTLLSPSVFLLCFPC